MKDPWVLYELVPYLLAITLLPTVLCIEPQMSCYETCLKLVTSSTKVISDGCTLSEDELYPNDERGKCSRRCEHIVANKCNTTEGCSFQTYLGTSSAPLRQYSNFTFINLKWNVSADADFYVLHAESNQVQESPFEIFPFVPRYYFVSGDNSTKFINFTVKNLLADIEYKFRVSSVSHKGVMNYSEWSPWYETNNLCSRTNVTAYIGFGVFSFTPVYINFPCPVTHLKLNMSIKILKKQPVVLDAKLSWKYPNGIEILTNYHQKPVKVTVRLEKHPNGDMDKLCESYHDRKFAKSFSAASGKEDATFHLLSNTENPNSRSSIHFGCRYSVQVTQVPKTILPLEDISFYSKNFFHIPECLNNTRSCPIINVNIHVDKSDIESENIDTHISPQSYDSYSTTVSWNLDAWDGLPTVEFFHITIEDFSRSDVSSDFYYKKDITVIKDVTMYSCVSSNMSAGMRYKIVVRAYHGLSCIQNKIERKTYEIFIPCKEGCSANATCYPPDTYDGSATCKCNYSFTGNGTFCTAIIPCDDGCSTDATCYPPNTYDGSAFCRCKDDFTGNGTHCTGVEIIENFVTGKESGTKSVNVVAAIVVPLTLLAVAVFVLLFLLMRKRKKKQSQRTHDLFNTLQEAHTNIPMSPSGSNLYQHFPSISNGEFPGKRVSLPEGREVNVLYVPQEIQNAIALGFTDGYEINAEHLRFGTCLGQGAFGNVYCAEAQGLGPDPAEWIYVAVKTLSDSAKQKDVDDFIEEIALMKDLGDHENVIKMLGCCTLSAPICLILEFAPHGNLQGYLRNLRSELENKVMKNDISKEKEEAKINDQNQNEDATVSLPKTISNENMAVNGKEIVDINAYSIDGVIESKELESFALQIAKGMAFVTSRGIVHRDLAARNILIGHDRILKISDFGLSREGVYVKTTSGKIPLRWLSVEAIRERLYSSASDVWAFGIVLWEICTLGGFPYPTISDRDLLKFLESGKRLEKPSNCTDEIYTIMLECWQHSPEARPTFSNLRDVLWKLSTSDSPYVNVDPLENFDFPPTNEDISSEDNPPDFTPDVSPEPKPDTVGADSTEPSGVLNPVFDDCENVADCDESSNGEKGDVKNESESVVI